jgi:alpha-N-acetylglucosaminidase
VETVYGGRADGDTSHGERDADAESLFDAQPSLTAVRASTWSPDQLRYDPKRFKEALAELLQVNAEDRATATYQYDLVDVARQAMANWSREALPGIKDAFDRRDEPRFRSLADQWLRRMELQDELLATNSSFLVGRWLENVSPWAASGEERRRLEYDARSILTTWGNRTASEAGLHDYGNKDWAGLTRDYYLPRWRTYFDSLDRSLREGKPPAAIDWFQLGESWNRDSKPYSATPHGDAWSVARQVAEELGISLQEQVAQ